MTLVVAGPTPPRCQVRLFGVTLGGDDCETWQSQQSPTPAPPPPSLLPPAPSALPPLATGCEHSSPAAAADCTGAGSGANASSSKRHRFELTTEQQQTHYSAALADEGCLLESHTPHSAHPSTPPALSPPLPLSLSLSLSVLPSSTASSSPARHQQHPSPLSLSSHRACHGEEDSDAVKMTAGTSARVLPAAAAAPAVCCSPPHAAVDATTSQEMQGSSWEERQQQQQPRHAVVKSSQRAPEEEAEGSRQLLWLELTGSRSATKASKISAPWDFDSKSPGRDSRANSTRYEVQKTRDWRAFEQYLGTLAPPVHPTSFTGEHVVRFLVSLDQFGKTKVHQKGCHLFGTTSQRTACGCPMKQAWGSLDSLIGRLRAAYEENGGLRGEENPFGTNAVRKYMREVREVQALARGLDLDKKKRKRKAQGSAE